MIFNDNDINRFWTKVDIRAKNECWVWTANKLKFGYGRFWLNGKTVMAHRFSYTISHGDVAEGMNVCHRCDNPSCVNPNHLFLGTHHDNTHDMITKDRDTIIGSKNNNATLTETDIPVIRQRLANGEMQTEIAKDYGVKKTAISAIKTGRSWKHI